MADHEAVKAAGNALRERWLREHPSMAALDDPMDWAQTALEAARPHLEAAAVERCAGLAGSLKFRLYRPAADGPGGGTQALDVVPLSELLDRLRQETTP